MIGDMDSGIVLDGAKGGVVTLKEYFEGIKRAEIIVNRFEIQEFIDALEEFK